MDTRKTILHINNVSHNFGPDALILHHLNTEIKQGDIVSVVGPSGCGKSTLLRAIVGTHPATDGTIMINRDGTMVQIKHPGEDRGIVYQEYSLFPDLTALENVAWGLKVSQTSIPGRLWKRKEWLKLRKEHHAEARELLIKLKLEKALDKYPSELSGGMKQRVAIASALIMKPKILLLDEPFSAIDEATREELQRMLLTLQLENQKAEAAGKDAPYTVLIVTHEINEAIFVGNRVIGLSQFWNWETKGHSKCPGATLVYDKPAPIFAPHDEKDVSLFREQKVEILHSGMDPEYLQDPTEFIELQQTVQRGFKANG